MNKLYSQLRYKIEKLRLSESSVLKLTFYRIVLGILKYIIMLTRGAGSAFPLIFQTQGPQTVTRSYNNFKSHQRRVMLVFWLLIIFILVLIKIR